MKAVSIFNSKLGVVANSCVVEDYEAMAVARAMAHSTGIKNVKEYANSIVCYDVNGRDSYHISIREV